MMDSFTQDVINWKHNELIERQRWPWSTNMIKSKCNKMGLTAHRNLNHSFQFSFACGFSSSMLAGLLFYQKLSLDGAKTPHKKSFCGLPAPEKGLLSRCSVILKCLFLLSYILYNFKGTWWYKYTCPQMLNRPILKWFFWCSKRHVS